MRPLLPPLSSLLPLRLIATAALGALGPTVDAATPNIQPQAEGQSKSWSPWSWNPIQGGGVASWARVTEFKRLDRSTLYGETIPNLWAMPNEPAAALLRQWTGFEPGMPDVVLVRCEFIAQRAVNDRWVPRSFRPRKFPRVTSPAISAR